MSKKDYHERLYELSSHLLPAVLAIYSDLSEVEAVDLTVNYSRSLLAELGYTPRKKRTKRV